MSRRLHSAAPRDRREILRFGLLGGAAGLGLPALLGLREGSAAEAGAVKPPDTAVILVFCHGGPSHLDTYDMKPEAPAEYRGPFKPIRTNVRGIEISELFPLQAKIADRYALIRSISHLSASHQDGAQAFMSGRPVVPGGGQPNFPDWVAVTSRLREIH